METDSGTIEIEWTTTKLGGMYTAGGRRVALNTGRLTYAGWTLVAMIVGRSAIASTTTISFASTSPMIV
jgi:hypothetical protein